MTPTPDLLDAFRNDLQRVAFHLEAHSAAARRGLADEATHHYGEAVDLVAQLAHVMAVWAEDARRRPAPAVALTDTPDPDPVLLAGASDVTVGGILRLPTADFTEVTDPPADEPTDVGSAVADAAAQITDALTPPAPVEVHRCDWPGCSETRESAGKLAAHRRKHATDQLRAEAHDLRVEAEAREATKKAAASEKDTSPPPTPSREMQGTTTTIGVYEVKQIGARRFIRCPETLCGKRVSLTDEETQFEIADTLDGHQRSPDCGARVAAAKRR